MDLAEEVFGASAADVSWLYSASLLAVLPCFFAAGPFVAAPATQRRALVLTHALNFVAAALRVAAVALRSYWVALASSLALGAAQGDHHLLHDAFKMPVPRFPDRGVGYRSGAAASLVISSFASVPLVWLPSDELGAGVAATVQSNFFGWFLGAVVVPYFRRADISPMNRGDAAVATWLFRGVESRWRRGSESDRPRRLDAGGGKSLGRTGPALDSAATATWIRRGDESRRRRGRDVEIPRRTTPPRVPRG